MFTGVQMKISLHTFPERCGRDNHFEDDCSVLVRRVVPLLPCVENELGLSFAFPTAVAETLTFVILLPW